jgi:sporulation protein YlmC with PRC-barrel domain
MITKVFCRQMISPVVIPLICLSAAMLTMVPSRAHAGQLVVVDMKPLATAYRASELTGASVVNEKDERIGTIDDIIITDDDETYAVISVGGFLGIGDRLVVVPYDSLKIKTDEKGEITRDDKIVLEGATKEELVKLPEFQYKG